MKIVFFLVFFLFGLTAIAQNDTLIQQVKTDLLEFKKKQSIDASDNIVRSLLNDLYEETLQSDNGTCSQTTLRRFQLISSDSSFVNGSILFLFNKYQAYITESSLNENAKSPQFQLDLIKLLADECVLIYEEIPTIVVVYMAESLMASGYIQKTINHIDYALQLYPNSIPLKVYKYLLNPDEYTYLKKQLLREHPNHWMVKEYITEK